MKKNMFSNNHFIIALTVLACIASCKKADDTFSGAKVLTVSDLRHSFSDSYTYNGDGSLAKVINSSGDVTTYTYSGDTVVMQNIQGGSVVANATVFLLGGDKYADTSWGLYQSQNSSARYAYDGNGQLTQQKYFSYGNGTSVYDNTLTSKNVTKQIITNLTTNTQTRYDYSYTTSTNTIGNQNFGKGFLGVGNLYLPQTRVQFNANNDTVDVLTYKYSFDDNSQVTKMVSYNRSGTLIDSVAYGY